MKRNVTLFSCILIALVAVLASCESGGEGNRSVIVVSAINEGGPVFSDVLEQGDTVLVGGVPFTSDDFIREDVIAVTFFNRPQSSLVTTGPGLPFSDFLVTGYRVVFERVDGAGPVPASFIGGMSLRVPSNESVQGAFVIVPFEFKNAAPLATLNYLGVDFPDEIQTIAHITFTGHEIGSEDDIDIEAAVTVNFADAVVESEANP